MSLVIFTVDAKDFFTAFSLFIHRLSNTVEGYFELYQNTHVPARKELSSEECSGCRLCDDSVYAKIDKQDLQDFYQSFSFILNVKRCYVENFIEAYIYANKCSECDENYYLCPCESAPSELDSTPSRGRTSTRRRLSQEQIPQEEPENVPLRPHRSRSPYRSTKKCDLTDECQCNSCEYMCEVSPLDLCLGFGCKYIKREKEVEDPGVDDLDEVKREPVTLEQLNEELDEIHRKISEYWENKQKVDFRKEFKKHIVNILLDENETITVVVKDFCKTKTIKDYMRLFGKVNKVVKKLTQTFTINKNSYTTTTYTVYMNDARDARDAYRIIHSEMKERDAFRKIDASYT